MKSYFVYIMTNRPYGALYIGVTSDLVKRVFEHKNGLIEGFTKRYGLKRLVYFEETSDVHAAIQQEKNMKHWVRQWKLNVINKQNPNWRDLAEDFGFEADPRDEPEDDSVKEDEAIKNEAQKN